jgi:AsmA protein
MIKILGWVMVVLVLLIGLILALPFFIDLNKYQDQYKPLIEEVLNRKIHLQDIRLTIWPRIGARVAGFAVLDDPSFEGGPFAELTSLDVGIGLLPLLSGKVEVEEITLHDPVIMVIKNENGVTNLATIGRKGVATPKKPSRAPIPSTEGPLKILGLLAVDRMTVTGGKLTYRDLSTANPTEYVLQDLEFLLKSVGLGQTPSMHLAALAEPFHVPITLNGTFGPLKETTDIDTINFTLTLGKTSFLIAGHTAGQDAAITISSPLINTANLPVALPFKKPVDVKDLHLAAEVRGQTVHLNDLSLQLFEGTVQAQGSLISGSAAPPFTGKTTLHGLQFGPALQALRTAQVSISGTAGADLSIKGQGFSVPDLTRALEGTGHLKLKDGNIEGVNFLQEAVTLLNVAGIAIENVKATAFSTIESDLTIKQGLIHVQRLLMDSHDFQATGSGTIGFDQALNLALNLDLSEALSQKLASSSSIAKVALKDGRLRLPFLISGTAHNPSYGLDMKGLTGKAQEQIEEKAKQTMKGLIEGTTKPKDVKQEGQELMKDLFGR